MHQQQQQQQHQHQQRPSKRVRRMKRAQQQCGASSITTVRTLVMATLAALCCCTPSGAFLVPPVATTTSCDRSSSSLPSFTRVSRARQLSRGSIAAVRMQQGDGEEEEIQLAVRNLVSQVEDLTAVVRQLAMMEPAVGGVAVDPLASSGTKKINGATVGDAAAPVVPAKAAKPLVRTDGALERIGMWLKESGGTPAPPPLRAVATPVAVAVAVAAPVVAAISKPVTVTTAVAQVASPPPPADSAPAADGGDGGDGGASTGYKVKIEWEGAIHEVSCDGETTILEAAMDAGLELPSSCMSGSCLTCPGKIISGKVDQSEGVLEDEQTEAGYMLTCVSYPESDLHFTVIDEEDLP